MTSPHGLIIAAPASGSGKTVLTLGLLRALRNAGHRVTGAKAGPDYIDPAFHSAASGRPAFNLDPWAMRPEILAGLVAGSARSADTVIVEGVMGLFDGVHLPDRPDAGSTADLAAMTGWPVVLIVDAAKQAASAGALVRGFASHRDDVRVAGVLFNRVASPTHEAVLRAAVEAATPEISFARQRWPQPCADRARAASGAGSGRRARRSGALHRGPPPRPYRRRSTSARSSAWPKPCRLSPPGSAACEPLPPLGQRIAVARDAAFAFAYPATLDGWHAAGAEILPFSPLADEAPDPSAGAIYLPGGYPELHGGKLAAAARFLDGLRGRGRPGCDNLRRMRGLHDPRPGSHRWGRDPPRDGGFVTGRDEFRHAPPASGISRRAAPSRRAARTRRQPASRP